MNLKFDRPHANYESGLSRDGSMSIVKSGLRGVVCFQGDNVKKSTHGLCDSCFNYIKETCPCPFGQPSGTDIVRECRTFKQAKRGE